MTKKKLEKQKSCIKTQSIFVFLDITKVAAGFQ